MTNDERLAFLEKQVQDILHILDMNRSVREDDSKHLEQERVIRIICLALNDQTTAIRLIRNIYRLNQHDAIYKTNVYMRLLPCTPIDPYR